ncbi:hypothetical protein [Clostridium peptidivorans]|uniref:hypothetical protein n=1 Tax=Clostridium peptidivorans TaxID=100174 RepID=UPI0015C8433D|nr:hypothetical protein [Clostridium peptidivorans]
MGYGEIRKINFVSLIMVIINLLIVKKSGKITNKKLISNDSYDMTNEVINIGTKK